MTAPPLPVSEEEVEAARRESYRHGGSLRGDLHTCSCGATWPDESPRGDGDDLWQDHVQACGLAAAHAVVVPQIERALNGALLSAVTTLRHLDWTDQQNREAACENGRAAFWRAMEEK